MTNATDVQEWSARDKTEWERGPWDHEPDKRQWVDAESNLDCLMVRNHGGAWCGYVGVPPKHPMYQQDYEKPNVEVHGGLTFADFCHEPSREEYDRRLANIPQWEAEAKRFPIGDSARALAHIRTYEHDYEGWCAYYTRTHICHVPLPGRPAKVWWFGFDCAHAGDKMDMAWRAMMEKHDPAWPKMPRMYRHEDVYRDVPYVEQEVAQLARQLAARKRKSRAKKITDALTQENT